MHRFEDYYSDSLEEEISERRPTQIATKRNGNSFRMNPMYRTQNGNNDKTPLSSDRSSNISRRIPIYRKEIETNMIRRNKSPNNSKPMISKSKIATLKRPESNNRDALSTIFFRKPKASYVNLFHAKIGYVQGSEPTETTRAVYNSDGFHTARSRPTSHHSSSDLGSHVSFVSDSSSFYLTFLEDEKRKVSELKQISFRPNASVRTNSPRSITSGNESKSSMNTSKNTSRSSNGKNKVDKNSFKVPILGGLGPDREAVRDKLELLKRKQMYGQRASDQNRLRIQEAKVMQSFKMEMKKATDLNNKTEHVLNS